MAETSRNYVPLTDAEERELCAYVFEIYTRAKNDGRLNKYQECYDAYNQIWREKLPKEWAWIQNIQLYMQTMAQLVDTWETTLSNIMFPNQSNFIDVEDEVTGEFWRDAVKLNYERTGFVGESEQGILQCAITGDNAAIVKPEGPFFKVETIPVGEIFFHPLDNNFTDVTKVQLIKKTEYQLRRDAVRYFNLDKLRALDWWKYQDPLSNDTLHDTHNPVRTGLDTSLGQGFLFYQAYIHYFKFSVGQKRELVNFVCTVCSNPKMMVRFEPQGAYDPYLRNTWKKVPKGLYYGKGVIEPNLNPLSYMNTMATLGLVDKFLRVLQVYTYDFTDQITKLSVLKRRMLLQPGALIATGRANTIMPLQRDNAPSGEAERHNMFWKNEMQETTGALPILSGAPEGTPDPTATLTDYRAQGATAKAGKIARHWDDEYTRRATYRVIKGIQTRFSRVPLRDQMGNIYAFVPGKNLEEMASYMQMMGWESEKIIRHINDDRYTDELLREVELTQIKPIGSQSQLTKIERQNALSRAAEESMNTPEINHVDWQRVTEERWKQTEIPNHEEFVISKEEQLEEQIKEIEQMLTSGIDTEPALPDGTPNPNVGMPLQPNQVQALMAERERLIMELTGEIQKPVIPSTETQRRETENWANPITGAHDIYHEVMPHELREEPGMGALQGATPMLPTSA